MILINKKLVTCSRVKQSQISSFGDAADLVKLHAVIVNWDSSNVKSNPTDLEALEPRQIIKVGGTGEVILIKVALLCWVIQESTK